MSFLFPSLIVVSLSPLSAAAAWTNEEGERLLVMSSSLPRIVTTMSILANLKLGMAVFVLCRRPLWCRPCQVNRRSSHLFQLLCESVSDSVAYSSSPRIFLARKCVVSLFVSALPRAWWYVERHDPGVQLGGNCWSWRKCTARQTQEQHTPPALERYNS